MSLMRAGGERDRATECAMNERQQQQRHQQDQQKNKKLQYLFPFLRYRVTLYLITYLFKISQELSGCAGTNKKRTNVFAKTRNHNFYDE